MAFARIGWLFFVLLGGAVLPSAMADDVRVQGAPFLTRVIRGVAPLVREQGIDIKIVAETGNTPAIEALGAGEADLAFVTRLLTKDERAAFPERQFQEIQIGIQGAAVVVARAVWESGVHALKRQQVQALYEGKVGNWRELGGEDRAIKFFDVNQGRGFWEMCTGWIYGDVRKAPAVPWESTGESADVATAVQFNSGGAGFAALGRADGREVFALALIDDKGGVLAPTPAAITSGLYPLARPAYVVSATKPAGDRRKVIEFLLSPAGQAALAENDLLPLVPQAPPAKP